MDVLRDYPWPGNVRELSNFLERMAVVKPGGDIVPADLPAPLRPADEPLETQCSSMATTASPKPSILQDAGFDLKLHLADVEKQAIGSALRQADGVVQNAAKILGMGRTTLAEKIRRHGLRA